MVTRKSLPLTLASIENANVMTAGLLQKYKCTKTDSMRAQLFIEETIVYWLQDTPPNAFFEVSIEKRFKTISLILKFCGKQANPMSTREVTEDSEMDANRIGQDILIGLSSVTYSYENGCNKVSYTLKQKPLNPAALTAIALIAGILTGVVFQNTAPSFGKQFAEMILTPVSSTFFSFLNAIVIPVLFFSTIGSIFNMENLAQMKRIFRLLLTWSVTVIVFTSALSLLMAQMFFLGQTEPSSHGGNEELWNQIGGMIFGIIPKNVTQPFLDGNTLQIMFLAIIGGVVMLTLKGRFPFVTKVINESNLIFSTILDGVCSLMPAIVFISILNMMVSGQGAALLGAFRLIGLILIANLVIIIFMLMSMAIIEKMSPIEYIKAVAPFAIIALSTASSSATFANHTSTALGKQNIRDYVVNFSIPVGVLFNKQCAIPLLLLTSLFVGQIYGISFTISEMIPVVILCMILSVAVPPSPGMGAFLFTIVFNLLGIPLAGLALAVTIDIFMDYPGTTTNVLITNVGMVHTEHCLFRGAK
jgi:Na+/H+-dicarboxylate symporter